MRKFIKVLLVLLSDFHISRIMLIKIKRIYCNLKKSEDLWIPLPDARAEYNRIYKPFSFRVHKKWLIVYGTISGVHESNFVPEDIYYKSIEPRLNYKPLSKAYNDKNRYQQFLKEVITPTVILKNISGVFYDSRGININKDDLTGYCERLKSYRSIIKPSLETGGGTGVRVIEFANNILQITPAIRSVNTITELFTYYRSDFLVQEYIDQHSFFKQFNSSSVNTVRLLTYRSVSDEKVHVLHRILRIGKPGSIVDNQAAGGIACGIDKEGTLNSFGVDKLGNKYFHNNGITFASIGKVPFIDILCEKAQLIAPQFPYARLLGLDFVVSKEGSTILLEINSTNNEINFYQMTCGPLFGNFTQEILEYSSQTSRSFNFDFVM